MDKFNDTPEKGALLILRVGTLLQTALLILYLGIAATSQWQIYPELSSIITLSLSLAIEGAMVMRPKAFKSLKGFYLPLAIAFQTLISISLPLLFTSQTDKTEFFISFWLLVPSAFIPLAIVSLQYNYITTFFYTLITNILDVILTVHIQNIYSHDMSVVMDTLRDYHLLRNVALRWIIMVMMGHILSVLVRSIRDNAAEIKSTNIKLEELNQHLEERVLERTQALETTNQKTLEGWVRLMELRRLEPVGHTARMLHRAIALGSKLNLSPSDMEILKTTVLLHDIGKLGLPDHILLKPGKLTDQEFSQSKLHLEYSVQILQGIDFLKPCIHVIAAHHERWDGSGYPRGLKEKEIPLLARVFIVLEVHDVMTHDTVYRKALTKSYTRKYFIENSGILYDPFVVTQFLGLLETQDLDDFASHL